MRAENNGKRRGLGEGEGQAGLGGLQEEADKG